MGKHGKKQSQQQRRGRKPFSYEEEEYEEERDFPLNPTQYPPSDADADAENKETPDEKVQGEAEKSDEYQLTSSNNEIPSKFTLYQQSVQSPKGDISYLQKFFLLYVGGRAPLHLQEDFCGTALLSTEWLRSDARRTAVGLDLDVEALNWCLENNINKIGADVSSRISLFNGNVLEPTESVLVNFDLQDLQQKIVLEDSDGSSATGLKSSCHNRLMKDTQLPARDIVCAFNYSCCCLHTRQELVSYFNHALKILNKKGGIFVMDLYGGTSSECELKLQRKFPNFTYTWEQAGFDIIQRKTRISLHFNLQKPNRKLRHAFSYSWRLWSLPEIKDCLEEAGFGSVHFWIRNMPNSEEMRSIDGFGAGRDIKYEEVTSFQQQDSWNAYVVGVV